MLTVAILSLLTSTAWAQTNGFIPQGISSSCSDYLNKLNKDTSLSQCLEPLVKATANYSPNAPNATQPTASSLSTALGTICGAGCPASVMRSRIGEFYAACTPELTSSKNDDVLRTYDVLYALTPLKEAACSKDDEGKWCVMQSTPPAEARSGPASDAVNNAVVEGDDLSKYLGYAPSVGKRGPEDQVALVPNTTTIAGNNILFLFLSGSLPSETLCKPCTKNVLSAYIQFETSVPYAPGLGQSVLLGGQAELYKAVSETCGPSFLGGAVQAAGGIGDNGVFGNGSPRSLAAGFSGIVAALAAVGFTLIL